jgi:hypothetical protein
MANDSWLTQSSRRLNAWAGMIFLIAFITVLHSASEKKDNDIVSLRNHLTQSQFIQNVFSTRKSITYTTIRFVANGNWRVTIPFTSTAVLRFMKQVNHFSFSLYTLGIFDGVERDVFQEFVSRREPRGVPRRRPR